MDLNININIDLSERTEKVIEDFVGTVMAMQSGVVMVAAPHEEEPQEEKPVEKPKRTRKAKAESPLKVVEETQEAPETTEGNQEETPAEATQEKPEAVEEAPLFNEPEPTPEETQVPELQPKDVRDAMERIREKFGDVTKDGEQVNPDLHRSLTRCFKAIASAMGFEKPSAIDNPAKRWEFVGALDGIRVENNQACPF